MTMMGWGYGGPGMMGGYGGGSVLGGLLMLFFWLIFVIGAILLVVWFVRSGTAHRMTSGGGNVPGAPARDDALDIARRRLASGEITPEQYEAIRKTLQGS